MSDKDKWKKEGGFLIEETADIEREEKCRKEIEKLVEDHGWKLEKPIGNLVEGVILVETDIRFDTSTGKRPLPDIKEFKGKLESILKGYGLGIRDFYDKGKSDDGYRRIEIKLKRTN
jgi:hypothetical protein